MNEKTMGIYIIRNKITGHFYVGQSVNIDKRLRQHKNDLKRNDHRCLHLQRAWNKYGEESLRFEIYIPCKKEELDEFEQMMLDDYWRDEILYNSSPSASNNRGIKLTLEHRKKLSDAKKGEKHPMFGKTHSTNVRKNISDATRGKKKITRSIEHCRKISENMKRSCEKKFLEQQKFNGSFAEYIAGGMKICRSCEEKKKFSKFHKATHEIDRLKHKCKECRSILCQKYYEKKKR